MRLSDSELEEIYRALEAKWKESLEKKWIKLPRLKNWDNYTIDSLVLIYFFNNYKKVVTKQELTSFIQCYKPEINDVQQWRHLSQQKWWYIISWQRWDLECKEMKVHAWEYMLYSLDEIYPGFVLNRKTNLWSTDFERIKELYDYRCVTCGSKEWEENLLYKWSITKLEKWHKNPLADLTVDNSIPQCDKCNKAYRNYFEFDNKWRVRAITDPKIILRSDENIQKAMFRLLKEKYWE